MIGTLTGTLHNKTAQTITLNVHGVGYVVWVNLSSLSKLGEVGETVTVITHLEVKEDSLTLFGFLRQSEYELFKLLLSVSGVGAKSALTTLDLGEPEELAQAIRLEEVTTLTQISGIGKKTAQRIILELKDKLGGLETESTLSDRNTRQDLFDALESLGYTVKEIQNVLSDIDQNQELGTQVRTALKLLQSS